MPSLIQRIFPPDPPLSPMLFSRLPVVHRFWMGGVLAAILGFALGFLLWSWQQGLLPPAEEYPLLRLWHARIQILLFIGSFLLGFALQSGPHVLGGPPPPSRPLLRLLPPLWLGSSLSLSGEGWLFFLGNLLISVAYLGAVYYLWGITRAGDPLRRLPRAIPLTLSFLPLAVAPWLALENPEMALWVLWCGPVSSALVAGQQLIQNVLGGKLLQGGMGRLFALALLLAWLLSTLAAFTGQGSWQWAGGAWLLVLVLLAVGTDLLRAVGKLGLASINITLVLGFAAAFAAAIWLVWPGVPLDGVVHLLGAGMLTTLIIGVAARVVGFFVGIYTLNDRLLSYLLLLWAAIALARVATPLGGRLPEHGFFGLILAGSLLLLGWSWRVILRLRQIEDKITPDLRERQE
ncbi:MAG: NnrS family protein [Magnetococcus sp. YQC-3]